MLTIAYITSRKEPKFEWFCDSLYRQVPHWCEVVVLIVDGCKFGNTGKPIGYFEERFFSGGDKLNVGHVEPKPTIWSGRNRITRDEWWSKSNSLNTAICLCETSHIAFVDDRCVLSPAWIHCVEEAIQGNYAVCGNYEKWTDLQIVNGEVVGQGALLGKDNRTQHEQPYAGQGWYGGSGALPLEWCLAVNGFSEDLCDGLGSEDSMFGLTLRNSGFPHLYDSRMLIIEDRTGNSGPEGMDYTMKRSDKGVSPNDKSHKIVEIFETSKTSQNSFNIREMRDHVLAGNPFPPPTASHVDWFDGAPISEMR